MKEYITPIMPIKHDMGNINVFIKRDDLLPFSFGGNKVRIALEYFMDMESKCMDCMIGYGSACSNLNRVLANLSYQNEKKCYIVSAIDDSIGDKTNNSDMVEACGAVLKYCTKDNVAETIQKVIDDCCEKGLNPYYINGDKYGKGNEAVPVRAYKKAYEEIRKQATQMNINFDYIFCATGTGMTQAGLIAGKYISNGSEKIVGISISRNVDAEKSVIKNYIKKYFEEQSILCKNNPEINVVDKYLCGGYGKYNSEVEKVISDMFKINGVPMDPVYTGKGFYGMREYIKDKKIKDVNVLFIHTGGTPLFFDNIDLIKN